MLKSIKSKLVVFNCTVTVLIIALLGMVIYFQKTIDQKNKELLNISNANMLINEMKEAFKAKQADVGWYIVNNDDDDYNNDDKTNYVDVYKEHQKEVDQTKSELVRSVKDLLGNDSFVELDKLNTQADNSFLNGIAKGNDILGNTKLFIEAIDNEDELTDNMAERLEAIDKSVTKDITNYLNYTYRLLLIIGVLIIVVVGICGLYFANYLTKPITNVANILDLIGKGDFSVEVSPKYLKYDDEVGVMARALANTNKAIRELIGTVQKSSTVIEDTTKGLSSTLLETTDSINSVAKAVDDLAQGSVGLAQSTQKSAEKLEGLSKEISTVNTSSNDIYKYIEDSKRAKNKGIKVVNKLQKAVIENEANASKVGDKIFELDEKSKKIGIITETIKNITSQINLLSLNAAIESARAGEAGRGFAVVSSEIKKLASDTASSTLEIDKIVSEFSTIIEETKNEVVNAKGVINDTSLMSKATAEAFSSIEDSAAKVIEQIELLSNEISDMNKNKEEVVGAIEDISAVSEEAASTTQEISASMEEQTVSMTQITTSSETLYKIALNLKELVDKFKI